MKAQTVNFERGLDPKDSLGIGNKNAREFRKALREKDYFSPVLSNMISGLENGSISESDAIQFTDGAIAAYDNHVNIFWHKWYHNTENNAYWNTDHNKWIITVNFPDDSEFSGVKVISEIMPSESSEMGKIFRIRTFALTKDPYEDFSEEHFEKENVFDPDDTTFTILFSMRAIASIIETTIKNLG